MREIEAGELAKSAIFRDLQRCKLKLVLFFGKNHQKELLQEAILTNLLG